MSFPSFVYSPILISSKMHMYLLACFTPIYSKATQLSHCFRNQNWRGGNCGIGSHFVKDSYSLAELYRDELHWGVIWQIYRGKRHLFCGHSSIGVVHPVHPVRLPQNVILSKYIEFLYPLYFYHHGNEVCTWICCISCLSLAV